MNYLRHFKEMRGSSDSFFRIVLVIVLLFGIVFRLGNLDTKPYWRDEVYTSMRVSGYELGSMKDAIRGQLIPVTTLRQYLNVKSGQDWPDALEAMADRPEHAPLYFVLARAWAKLFGSSVGSMRAFPALISLLMLPLFYQLSRLLFGSTNVANATLCLACTSPILIRYAQEARPYSLWMVGILLSSIALLSALRQSKGRTWVLYSATVAFMLATQLLSFFVLFAHSLYVLVLFKSGEAPEVNGKKTKHFFVSLAAGTVPIIPWLGLFFSKRSSVEAATAWRHKEMTLHQLAADWLQNVNHLIFSWKPNISDGLLVIGVPVVLLIAWSTFQMISKSHLRQWLLPVLLCVVPAVVFVLSDLVLGGQSSVVARYFLPTFIGTVLILGFGISPSPPDSQRRSVERSVERSAARVAKPSWQQQLLFYTVLTITLSASWYSLHAFTWWESPDRDRQTTQEISQVSSVATIVSDLDIGSFTEFALFLRPTDYVLWLNSGDGVPYEIFDEAAATFLLEPSDDLFKRVIRAAAERQFVVEPLQSHLFQIKHSA